jgi:hypothetical protein
MAAWLDFQLGLNFPVQGLEDPIGNLICIKFRDEGSSNLVLPIGSFHGLLLCRSVS